jgi:hypothetical protein
VSLPAALAAAAARLGVDRRGYRGEWWGGDDGLWHVELLSPVRDEFGGATLAQALGWCPVGVMGWCGEFGPGTFA